MNIRGLLGNILPSVSRVEKQSTTNAPKLDASADRDANGRREQAPPEQRKLTPEELEKLKAYLKDLPAFKDSTLEFEFVTQDKVQVLLIKDHSGKLVKRIPELEFLAILRSQERLTGKLLNRAI